MSSDNQRLQLSIEQKNGKIRSLENKYVGEFFLYAIRLYVLHNQGKKELDNDDVEDGTRPLHAFRGIVVVLLASFTFLLPLQVVQSNRFDSCWENSENFPSSVCHRLISFSSYT